MYSNATAEEKKIIDDIFHQVIVEDNIKVIKALLEFGVMANGKDYLYCIVNKKLEIFKLIIDSFPCKELYDTFLMHAAMHEAEEIVEYLVAKGGDFGAILRKESGVGNLKVIEMLLKRGIDIESPNNHGITPLIYAIRKNNIDSAKFLLEKGADFDKQDKYGWPPLFYALKESKPEVVEFLLEQNPKLDLVSFKKTTTLHLAVTAENFSLVKTLIDGGADVMTLNDNGETPLGLAYAKGTHSEIYKYLVTYEKENDFVVC